MPWPYARQRHDIVAVSATAKRYTLHRATRCEGSLGSAKLRAFGGELDGPGGQFQALLGRGGDVGPDGPAAVADRAVGVQEDQFFRLVLFGMRGAAFDLSSRPGPVAGCAP